MNRLLIAPSLLAVALAASAPPVADTQGRGEGGIVILDNAPIYGSRSAAVSTGVHPKIVKLGQTFQQVDQILGAPQKILKAGTDVIYVYQDLKLTFENGKVADLQ